MFCRTPGNHEPQTKKTSESFQLAFLFLVAVGLIRTGERRLLTNRPMETKLNLNMAERAGGFVTRALGPLQDGVFEIPNL